MFLSEARLILKGKLVAWVAIFPMNNIWNPGQDLVPCKCGCWLNLQDEWCCA